MTRRMVCFLTIVLTIAGGGYASQSQSVNKIIDDYVRALGGEAAYAKFSTRLRKGTVEIVGVPGKGEFEEYSKAPNKMVGNITFPGGLGVAQLGFDGVNGWKKDVRTGLVQDLKGVELAEVAFDSFFNEGVRIRDRYARFELKGIEKVNNRDAYLVIAKPVSLPPEKLYFDVQTGLLLRSEVIRGGGGSDVVQIIDNDKYEQIDGVKFPFVERHKANEITFVVNYTSIQNNVPIDESIFQRPRE